jgi:hypothetical protein
MGYAVTSHNRAVYASPPAGGSDYGFAGHSATFHSHAKPPPHFVGHWALRSKALIRDCQNVVNSRNVMRNTG